MILLGAITLLRPGNTMDFICISFGVCMLADSLFKAKIAFEAKDFGIRLWWLTLVLAILTGLAALMLIFRPAETIQVMMVHFGISLLTEGMLSLSVAVSMVKIIKNQKPDVIDADFEII